jgi:hypothetical protein
MRAQKITAIAAHEAGHAVVAYALGYVVKSVRVGRENGYDGTTESEYPEASKYLDDDRSEKVRANAFHELIRAMAGLAAEDELGFKAIKTYYGKDLENIQRAMTEIESINPGISQQSLENIHHNVGSLANIMVNANRNTIRRLAQLLTTGGTASAAQVDQICKGAVVVPDEVRKYCEPR